MSKTVYLVEDVYLVYLVDQIDQPDGCHEIHSI